MHRRGEALTITLAVIAGVFVLGTLIPQVNPANWFRSTPNTTSSNWNRTTEVTTPQVAIFDDGRVVVANKVERTTDKGSEKSTPKLTLMQKVGNWISDLSFVAFVGLCIALALGIVTPAGLAWWARNAWKDAFAGQVSAIRSIEDDDTYKKVTKAIKQHQEARGPKKKRRDERLVDRVKMEAH